MAMHIKGRGKFLRSLNSNFIALIPKIDHLDTFGNFNPIVLCNMLYNIVAKIVSTRINPILSHSISLEQFGFLQNMHIHEVVGVPHEAIHSIKTRN